MVNTSSLGLREAITVGILSSLGLREAITEVILSSLGSREASAHRGILLLRT